VCECVKLEMYKVMYVVLESTATETLAFLCEMPKSHDLRLGYGYVIRISKLPKIAKIYCVRPALPQCPSIFTVKIVQSACLIAKYIPPNLFVLRICSEQLKHPHNHFWNKLYSPWESTSCTISRLDSLLRRGSHGPIRSK
jgi:hypothetical protein